MRWGILWLLPLVGCAAPARIDVTVSVVPDEAASLEVGLTVATAVGPPTSLGVQPVSPRGSLGLGRFQIELPAGARGPARVDVAGISAGDCLLARGSGTVDLGDLPTEPRYELTVPVDNSDDPGCVLRVRRYPDEAGAVQVQGEPLCEASAGPCPDRPGAAGARLRLTAATDEERYFLGWSGPCQGTAPCQVTLDGRRPVVVPAGFQPREICSSAWCWQNPLPQGAALHHVFGFDNERWAVGDAGTVLRSPGDFWARMQAPTSQPLRGGWPDGADGVWLVGDENTVLRWRRGVFTEVPPPLQQGRRRHLASAWASAGDLWTVGSEEGAGVLLHYAGSWQEVAVPAGPPLLAIHGGGAGAGAEVWAVGEGGRALRLVGGRWQSVDSGTTQALRAVWRLSPDEVWAAGQGCTLVRFRSGRSELMPRPDVSGPCDLAALWGSGPKDLWAAGAGDVVLHWDGDRFVLRYSGSVEGHLAGLHGEGGQVWAVGALGTLLRWNGLTMVPESRGAGRALRRVFAGSDGSGGDDVWAVGMDGTILRNRGSGWSGADSPVLNDLYGVWGNGPNDVWAVGARGVSLRWDGAQWAIVNLEGGPYGFLAGAYGFGPSNTWLFGEGVALQVDSTTGMVTRRASLTGPVPVTLWGAWGAQPNDLWFVGATGSNGQINLTGGVLFHQLNGAFQPPQMVEQLLLGVWGLSARDIWAVGATRDGRGVMLHYDGTRWTVGGTADAALLSVWGARKDDVWAVGSGGLVMRYDGQRWQRVNAGTSSVLFGLHGTKSGGAWAVGYGGGVLHRSAAAP